jgi:hypothetical protein
MNERINDIHWKAHASVRRQQLVDADYLEKFAELIVKECYLWAKENGGLGCEEDFEALKEHFGVEE